MDQRRKPGEQVELLFAEAWQMPRLSGLHRGYRPNLDSYHTDEPHELTVIVELPGVDPGSLEISVSERSLVIAGARTRAKGDGRVYQQIEIEYGAFERTVRLAEDVDPEQARARYEQGMLTISLPVSGRPRAGAPHNILVERA
jgi:HSP20 family protein